MTNEKGPKTKIKNRENPPKNSSIDEKHAGIAKLPDKSKRGPGKSKLVEKGDDSTENLSAEAVDRKELVKSFGTADPQLQILLLSQVVRSFEGALNSMGVNKGKTTEACNLTLSIVNGIQPRDEIEGMLSVQMIAIHNLIMQNLSWAMMGSQSNDGRERLVNQATKMLRTFTSQMEALKKYRTGGQQKVTVEHVHVNAGGQAIVGSVSQGGGGSNEKKEG